MGLSRQGGFIARLLFWLNVGFFTEAGGVCGMHSVVSKNDGGEYRLSV